MQDENQTDLIVWCESSGGKLSVATRSCGRCPLSVQQLRDNHVDGMIGVLVEMRVRWIVVVTEEHRPELRRQLISSPFFFVWRQCKAGRQGRQLRVAVRIRNIQIVDQNYVRILQQPVTTTMKGRQNCRVHVTAVNTLDTLNLRHKYVNLIEINFKQVYISKDIFTE